MRPWNRPAWGQALAALCWLATSGASALAQGGGAPSTPEEERFAHAAERVRLEVSLLRARAKVAEAELGGLIAARELEVVRAKAREAGYLDLAQVPAAQGRPIDPVTSAILDALDRRVSMPFAEPTPLGEIIKYVKSMTQSPALAEGIPIYVDPVGLQEAEKTESSPVKIELEGVELRESLKVLLRQIGLVYTVKQSILTITSESSADFADDELLIRRRPLQADPAAEVLGQGVGIGFAQPTPLAEVLESLEKVWRQESPGVTFAVTTRATASVAGSKVTIKADGTPLRINLTRILGPLGLGYTTRGGMIVVDKLGPPAIVVPPAEPPKADGVKPSGPPEE